MNTLKFYSTKHPNLFVELDAKKLVENLPSIFGLDSADEVSRILFHELSLMDVIEDLSTVILKIYCINEPLLSLEQAREVSKKLIFKDASKYVSEYNGV